MVFDAPGGPARFRGFGGASVRRLTVGTASPRGVGDRTPGTLQRGIGRVMNLKPSPSAPQQVAFKRVCSTIYDAYGDQILVDGIDVTREYVVGRMLADLQMADAATLSRVLGVLEGVPARSAGRAPTRHYALALVALYLESASWDTLALVAETLHSNAGQVEPPGRVVFNERPERERGRRPGRLPQPRHATC